MALAHLLRQYRYNRMRRFISSSPVARGITIFLFLLVLGSVAIGIYEFGTHSLRYITSDAYLRDALPLYVYELFFLIIAGLVFFSGSISVLLKFFTRERVAWIMVTPSFAMLPYYMLSGIFAASLWPLLIVGLPMLLAVQTVFHLSVLGFITALCAIILLVVLAVLAAVICLLVVTKVLHHFHRLTRKATALSVLAIVAVLAFGTWATVGRSNAVQLFHGNDLHLQVARLQDITSEFSPFPSHQAALVLHGLTHHESPLVVQSIALLITEIVLLFLLLRFCLPWYLDLWKALQENPVAARVGRRRTSARPFPRFSRGVIGSIFEKESLTLYRSTTNALWFSFVFFLWLIQTSLNFYIQRTINAAGTHDAFPSAIEAFQVVAAVFFVTAFVLRFALPAFSTERKTAWILASAPIRMRTLFWSKLSFYAPVFVAMAIVLGVVNTTLVPIPLQAVVVFLSFLGVSTFVVTALGLSLGALFPSFETDDPEVLSTSLPGLFFTIAAIGYGIGGAAIFNLFLQNAALLPVVAFEVLSVVGALVLLYFAGAALEHIDFA